MSPNRRRQRRDIALQSRRGRPTLTCPPFDVCFSLDGPPAGISAAVGKRSSSQHARTYAAGRLPDSRTCRPPVETTGTARLELRRLLSALRAAVTAAARSRVPSPQEHGRRRHERLPPDTHQPAEHGQRSATDGRGNDRRTIPVAPPLPGVAHVPGRGPRGPECLAILTSPPPSPRAVAGTFLSQSACLGVHPVRGGRSPSICSVGPTTATCCSHYPFKTVFY